MTPAAQFQSDCRAHPLLLAVQVGRDPNGYGFAVYVRRAEGDGYRNWSRHLSVIAAGTYSPGKNALWLRGETADDCLERLCVIAERAAGAALEWETMSGP